MSGPFLDSTRFLIDPDIGNYMVHQNVDLTASTYPQEQGKYIVFQDKAKENETIIVKAVVPYAQARQGAVGAEYIQMISPSLGNGAFLFEPRVNSQAGFKYTKNAMTPYTDAASASNDQRSAPSGITFITDDPLGVAYRAIDSAIMGFVVPPNNTLTVLFSLMKPADSGPIDGRYSITTVGSSPVEGTRRVDYAGVWVVGLRMSQARYDALVKEHHAHHAR